MLTCILIVFLVGYLCIALEHPLKINKAGTALLTGTILWVLYTFSVTDFVPTVSGESFEIFKALNPSVQEMSLKDQCIHFVLEH